MRATISGHFRLGAGGKLEKCEKVELQEGQIIWLNGYGQSEHWHERQVVFKREDTRYGVIYHAVNIDKQPPVISRHEAFTIRPVNRIFGIGIYYTPGEMFEGSHQELDQMIFKALEHQRQETERREAESERVRALEEAGKKVWAKMEAAGAKSLIVAELKEDRSDLMTDYFHSVTVKTVILGTSKSSRNNFKELRKLAAQASISEIQALAIAPTEHEHRDNYSGGGGYYLGESQYSGWIVRKVPPYGEYMEVLGLNKI